MNRTFKFGSLLVLSGVFAAACSDEDDAIVADSEYGYVYDEADWADYDAGVTYAFADPIDDDFFAADSTAPGAAPTMADVAAQSAAGMRNYFTPASCVTSSSSGATVNVTLNGCTGPVGARTISGNLAATFGQIATGFSLKINASNVTIGDRTAQWQADGTATRTSTGWNLAMGSSGTATRADGTAVTRNALANIDWARGSGCVTADVQSTLMVNGVSYTNRMENYQRCTGACPTGGTLFLDGPNQDVTVTFDGSNTPAFSSTTGVTSELQLSCGG